MNTWDLMMNWSYVLPPSRPSAKQLNNISNLCKDIDRNAPVAVLGSTPEFRDLLYEAGFSSIYVFDKNLNFYQSMSKLRVYNSEEKYVEGDWLVTLPNFQNSFALVLSDLTSGNLPYEVREEYYSAISNALSYKGLFYDKVLTHSSKKIPFEDLVNKYSRLPLNLLYINYFSSEMLFCSELIDIDKTVNTTLFYEIIEDRVENPRVKAFSEQSKSKITPVGGRWYYGLEWDILKKDYCIGLSLVSEEIESDLENPYVGRMRFFTMQKNKIFSSDK